MSYYILFLYHAICVPLKTTNLQIVRLCSLLIYAMLNCFSGVQLFATLRTVARQAPLSMRCSSKESWSGLPWPPLRIYQSSMLQISKYKSSNTENKITFYTLPLPKSARASSCVYMYSDFFAHTQSELGLEPHPLCHVPHPLGTSQGLHSYSHHVSL